MSNENWICKKSGKWCASNKSIDSEAGIGWVEVQNEKGRTIAMVTDDGGGYTLSASDKEMERRAHLIAAAPELYQALDCIVGLVEHCKRVHLACPITEQQYEDAINALQKARGEKQ